MFQFFSAFKDRINAAFRKAATENWLEGIRLNLLGGSARDTFRYLKETNRRG